MNSNKTASSSLDKSDEEIVHKMRSLSPDVQALIKRYIIRLLESDKYQN